MTGGKGHGPTPPWKSHNRFLGERWSELQYNQLRSVIKKAARIQLSCE